MPKLSIPIGSTFHCLINGKMFTIMATYDGFVDIFNPKNTWRILNKVQNISICTLEVFVLESDRILADEADIEVLRDE